MKTITTLLSIIIVVSLFGCATAVKTKQQNVPNTTTEDRIKSDIAQFEKPISDATKALEAKPEWQEFMLLKKEVVNMPEYKRLQRLENSRSHLMWLLEGGK